jgi:hypothetical protein
MYTREHQIRKIEGTQSIPNYKTFDFFNTKFDHSFYSKIYAKYNFFLPWLGLLIKVLQE